MRPRFRSSRAALLAAIVLLLCPPAPVHAARAHAAKHRARRALAPRPASRGARAPEAFGAPVFDSLARAVRWPLRAALPLGADDRRLLDELRASRGARDSIAAWRAAGERDSLLAPGAWIEAARIALVARDSLGAGALLEAAEGLAGPWRWTARRQRARLVLAVAGAEAADSVLRTTPAGEMSDAEREERDEDRVDLLLRLGRGDEAIALARRAVAAAAPASPPDGIHAAPWIAARIERRLEEMLRARGERPSWSDDTASAQAALALGDRAGALARLERASLAAPLELRWRPTLQRAGVLRRGRRYEEARVACRIAEALAPDSSARGEALLARLGLEADARGWAEADRLADELAAWPDPRLRTEALALRARALESRGEWERAAEAFAAHWRADTARADRAAFHAGLLSLALGRADSARLWFTRTRSEGSRFWRAVLLRRTGDRAGDSLLAGVAGEPGYSFYAVAARETLGVRGWPGIEVASPAGDTTRLRMASLLLALGREADARAVVARWLAWTSDRRAGGDTLGALEPVARQVLQGAALAYSSKSEPYAIVLAELAPGFQSDSGAARRWPFVPWAYPPAYESAFAALADSVAADGIDRALLRAVARKESHFNAAARSPSDALGLLQLKLGTAKDAARALRLRRPRERDLLDPAGNVRLGAAYLRGLLRRFGGLPRALAAYNAGPAALARWLARWQTAPGRDLGGVALECELTCREETIRYVKEILAARQAYRELRPAAAP